MKKMTRICGILLVIAGLLLYFAADEAKSAASGVRVYTGYKKNGEFIETNSGYMGRNEEARSGAQSLQTFGTAASVVGGIMVVASFFIKTQNDESTTY